MQILPSKHLQENASRKSVNRPTISYNEWTAGAVVNATIQNYKVDNSLAERMLASAAAIRMAFLLAVILSIGTTITGTASPKNSPTVLCILQAGQTIEACPQP